MLKELLIAGGALLLSACSKSVPVDAATALPGKWNCNGEIVILLNANNTYEWQVPAGGPVVFSQVGGNEHMRTNSDGSYALLGKWRLAGASLEMDMLGETDQYQLAFESAETMKLKGPETYSCTRQ